MVNYRYDDANRPVLSEVEGLTSVNGQATTGLTTGLLAQYDSGTWAYHVSDGLGSVRKVVSLMAGMDKQIATRHYGHGTSRSCWDGPRSVGLAEIW